MNINLESPAAPAPGSAMRRPAAGSAPRLPAAVLWDFDGTLVDTEPIWMRTEYALVEEWGGTWNDELAYRMVGNSLEVTAEHLLEASRRTDLDADEVLDRLVSRVVDALRGETLELRPGVAELLDRLAATEVPCALVSASFRVILETVLERLPVNPFRVVVAGDDVARGKPDPEPYLLACRRLGVHPADCVVIEDSVTGADSGNAAGAVVAGVRNHVDIPAAPRRFLLDSLAGVDERRLAHELAYAGEGA